MDPLQIYHTALRATASSGYPNMSYYNPMNTRPPAGMDMTGDAFQAYRRVYAQKPMKPYGIRRQASKPYWI